MRGKGKATLDLIEATKSVLEEIQPASVRAVCYRLFVQKQIPDMSKNSVSRVGEQLVYAREEGIIPWPWVVDETQSVECVECWKDFESHFDDLCASHQRDLWDRFAAHFGLFLTSCELNFLCVMGLLPRQRRSIP